MFQAVTHDGGEQGPQRFLRTFVASYRALRLFAAPMAWLWGCSMRAWTFQDRKQKAKHGDKCPWSVGWYDGEGKRRQKRIGSKSQAEKYQRRVEGELAAGTYQTNQRKQWKDFRTEYESKIADGMEPGTRRETVGGMDHFERIIKPGKIQSIKTQTIDDYIAKRRREPGKKKKSTISVATVNKELRHLKAVLRVANDWGYLPSVPRFRMLREPAKEPRFVCVDHFAEIYAACDVATMPKSLPCEASQWWRALLVFCYMTGWRISEPLALRWDDVNLETGVAITRHGGNKGKRDELAFLHPIVIDHLQTIRTFEPVVFPWYHHRRTLDTQWDKIQNAAGIHLPCHEDHEHTPACHLYGFHDLRRAFATENAENLTATELQRLMRHKSSTLR